MVRFDAHFGRLLTALALAGAALVLFMTVAITADVVLRNLGLGGAGPADELSEYALYLVTLTTAPWLLRQGQHVRVDVAVTMLPARLAWHLEIVADLVGLAVSLVLIRTGWIVAAESARAGSMTVKTLIFPEWWLYVPLPICFRKVAFTRLVSTTENDSSGSGSVSPAIEMSSVTVVIPGSKVSIPEPAM